MLFRSDTTLEFAAPMLLSYLNAGVVYPRMPDRHHAIAPYGIFRCRDGSLVLLAVEQDGEWRRFAEAVLGRPELADDPRFATAVARLEQREEVDGLVATAIAGLDCEEAIRTLDNLGLAYASLNDMRGISGHPVVAEREMITEVTTAGGSTVRAFAGLAQRLFATVGTGRERPPTLGEDTDEILESLGLPVLEPTTGTEAP